VNIKVIHTIYVENKLDTLLSMGEIIAMKHNNLFTLLCPKLFILIFGKKVIVKVTHTVHVENKLYMLLSMGEIITMKCYNFITCVGTLHSTKLSLKSSALKR
jgi:hypothetical protein